MPSISADACASIRTRTTPMPAPMAPILSPPRLYLDRTPQQYRVTVVNNNQYTARSMPFDLALFYQDDLAINRRLTFSYGLRWETQNEIHDKSDFAPRIYVAYALGTAKGNPKPSCAPAMDGFTSASPYPTAPTPLRTSHPPFATICPPLLEGCRISRFIPCRIRPATPKPARQSDEAAGSDDFHVCPDLLDPLSEFSRRPGHAGCDWH